MSNKSKVTVLPQDAKERKKFPLFSGCMNYFPNALLLVARQSYMGNEQHNPGKPLHWDRSKSGDELDALVRHVEEGEWVAVAWRALAHLEKMVEQGYNPFAEQSVGKCEDVQPSCNLPKFDELPVWDGIRQRPEDVPTDRFVECKCGKWELSMGMPIHHVCSACGNRWIPFRSFSKAEASAIEYDKGRAAAQQTVHKGVGEGDEGLDITKCIGREAVISLLNHGIDPYKPNP